MRRHLLLSLVLSGCCGLPVLSEGSTGLLQVPQAFKAAGAFQLQIANNPPRLRVNAALQGEFNKTFTITATNLFTDDVETVDPSEIIYTISPGSTNEFDSVGRILLRGIAVTNRGTFSQEDINLGRVTYRAPASIDRPSERIPFTVQDADGNFAADGPFKVFTFVVDFPNSPPVAVNGSASVPLGGRITGQLSFQDADSWQGHTFRIVQQGTLGTATITDTNTGAFVYQASTPGVAGSDVFTFHVNDGEAETAQPGEFRLLITNQPPQVASFNLVVKEDEDPVTGRLTAQDPDQPAQALTFRAESQTAKGALTLNAATGEFTYAPAPGRFGRDEFQFSASDGQFTSALATVSILIKGTPEHEDLLVTGVKADSNVGVIYLVNPEHNDFYELVEGDFLRDAASLIYDPVRKSVFIGMTSNDNALIAKINIETGEATPVIMNGLLKFPLGMTLDDDGQLLVANAFGTNILSVNPDTGVAREITSGNLLKIPAAVAVAASGDLLVLDVLTLFEDDGRIVRVNPLTGEQTLFLESAQFLDPTDLILLPNGNMLVGGRGGILEVLPDKTIRTILPQSAFQQFGKEMVLDETGQLFVVDFNTGILRVDLATGASTPLVVPGLSGPVAIAAVSQPNNIARWRAIFFEPEDLGDPAKESTVWGDAADPDGDGAANLYEYALDLNPIVAGDGKSGFAFGVLPDAGRDYFALQFKSRKTDATLRYTVEVSSDLKVWTSAGEFDVTDVDSAGAIFDVLTYRYKQPITPGDVRFFRLKVERTP